MFLLEEIWSHGRVRSKVLSRDLVQSRYRAISLYVYDIMWIRQLLMEVGIETSKPTKLWCDNQAVMHIAFNPIFHERTNILR